MNIVLNIAQTVRDTETFATPIALLGANRSAASRRADFTAGCLATIGWHGWMKAAGAF